jgi:hypothetical protein
VFSGNSQVCLGEASSASRRGFSVSGDDPSGEKMMVLPSKHTNNYGKSQFSMGKSYENG